jgi:beta-lactamase class A
MVFFVILSFGIGAFIVVFVYQWVLTAKINIFLKFFSVLFLTLILLSIAYLREKQISRDSFESMIVSPLASPIASGVEAIHYITKVQGLEKVVKPLIQNEKGIYAVGIKNLKTGDEYYLNENKQFETASLYKLWVMATVFQKVGQGNLSLNQTLSANVTDLNKAFGIDESDAELTEGVITNTVAGALNKMITISDNYSAYLLAANVRFSVVSQFLAANGFSSSRIGNGAFTDVTDMVSYFEKLYNKQLVSEDASNQMMALLRQQQINDRIPKYLPDGTVVAHKTGELDGVKHDAGIVFSPKGDYIIVLLSDTNDLTHAAEVEANISKAVWEYFDK